MRYFDGLSFVIAGGNGHTRAIHRKSFKDYYGLQFYNGEGLEIQMDSKSWRLDGSWVLLTYPGPFFQYGPPEGTESEHSYICFKGPRVDAYLASGLLPLNPERPLFKITAPQRFQEALDKLLAIQDLNSKGSHDGAVNLLEGLLLQLQSQPEPLNIAPRLQAKISALHKELRHKPELEWDFHDEARRMGVSYIYLRTLFRKLAGMPPGAFLLECRIEKASKMLLNSDAQVSEISALCGFSDVFYFSRAFKKRRLISPLRYRKEFSSSIL